MNNRKLTHEYANDPSKNLKGSNLFSENEILYSYGYHFPIAKPYYNNNSEIFLINSSGYSNTTVKHKSLAFSALSHKITISVPEVILINPNECSHKHHKNLYYLISNFRKSIQIHCIAIKNDYTGLILKSLKQFKIYYNVFNIEKFDILNNELKSSINEILNFNIDNIPKKEISEKLKQERKEKLKKENEEFLIKLAEWKEIKYTYSNFVCKKGYTYLRFNPTSNTIQTSKGIDIEIDDARTLLNKIDKNIPIHGMAIDNFTITSYDKKFLKVGCHTIPQKEIDYIREYILNK